MTKVVIGTDTVETKANVAENWGTAQLVEDAVRNGEGLLAKDGPLVVATGKHTGRSAKDKFIVQDAETADTIWWGKTNVPMTPAHFASAFACSSVVRMLSAVSSVGFHTSLHGIFLSALKASTTFFESSATCLSVSSP